MDQHAAISMAQIQQFLITMAALSTGAQQLTDYLFKKRFQSLDQPSADPVAENRRQSTIHLIAAVIGAVLAASTGLHPLREIGASFPSGLSILEFPITGLLVSFGGSFFNEALGALGEFKDAQTALKNSLNSGAVPPTPAAPPAAAAPVVPATPATPAAPAAPAAPTTVDSDQEGFFDAANAG